MKIAFITIGTGEYRKLVSPLTDSIGEFMLKSHEIRTVAFADDKISTDIYRKIEALPWPLTTLFKYRYINTLSSDLSGCDMMYFIDADCRVVAPIGEEIFPERGQIVVVEHPWQQFNSGAYENNPKSTAYVNRETCKNHYFQACFFGGYAEDILRMSGQLEKNIETDLKNNLIALCHDESHLNRYVIDNPKKQLDCGYAHPKNGHKFKVNKKIIHLNYRSSK